MAQVRPRRAVPKVGPHVQTSSDGGARRNPKSEDCSPGDMPTNPGGGGKKPPGGKAVAAPGGDGGGANNPFKDGGPFPTFEDSVGLPPGSLDNVENIGPATNEEMKDLGFSQKWVGEGPDGTWYSAYSTDDGTLWAGGKISSRNW